MMTDSFPEQLPVLIKGLSVSYGRDRPVFEDLDLQIGAGQTFGLLGLNGAGKTTLIKTILGLRTQYDGTVSVFGLPPDHHRARQRIAYLPERFEPAWFLTGREFLSFSLRLYGVSPRAANIDTLADLLALSAAVLDKRVQTYSKGMRQKLGLLATVLTDCDVFILDEPMSGLDPLSRHQVQMILKDLKRRKKTILLCSHILTDVEALCDRVAILHDGQIVFNDTPGALYTDGHTQTLESAFLQKIGVAAA